MLNYTDKYHVVKRDGIPVTWPSFVLRVDGSDPHAIIALETYANSIKEENPQLAEELFFISNKAKKNKITSLRELLVALKAR